MFTDNNFSNIFKNFRFNGIEFKIKQLKKQQCFNFFTNSNVINAHDL